MRLISTFSFAASLMTAASTIAIAADLPSRRAPPVYVPPPVPVFTWTGFYIGGNAGYAFGAGNNGNASNNSYFFPNGSVRGSPGTQGTLTLTGGNNGRRDGFTGGGQIGYNYELGSGLGFPGAGLLGGLGGLGTSGGAGGIVVGIEADAQYLRMGGGNFGNNYTFAGSTGLAFVPVVGAPRATLFVNGQQRRSDYFGTVRGRLGFTIDRAFFFGSGGFAYSDRTTGYAVGGGIEYAITNNVTLRAEYLYVDLGRNNGNGATLAFNEAANRLTLTPTISNRETFNVVRGAINYKFGAFAQPAPVVARY